MKDETLLETLRKLLASDEGRPEGLLPVDMLLTVRLLLQGGDERPVYASQSTLARELGCTEGTINTASQRLKEAGWLELETGKGRWQSNKYFVLLGKLPLEEKLRRTVVSDAAVTLAKNYMTVQRAAKPKRIFRKGTEQRYAYRLQTLLDKCGGDEQLLRQRLRFALGTEKYRAAALRGPHVIRRSWKSLTADYEAAAKAVTVKEQAAA
jgi:biotin operon repressor